MADLATIGFRAETSQLADAKDKLDALVPAAASAERATEGLNREFQQGAQKADFYDKALGRVSNGLLRRFVFGAIISGIAGLLTGFPELIANVAALGETAKRAGVELAQFQALRLAAAGQGIKGDSFDKGIEGLAEKLNEARQKENDLTKFLDENNVKYKDRKGEVISTNEALGYAAELIKAAATEQDKIKIAEAFGLPKDFVPLLENGVEALRAAERAARDAGATISADVVAKAKDFDDAWNTAWANFSTYARSAIATAATGIGDLIKQVGSFLNGLGNAGVFQKLAGNLDQAGLLDGTVGGKTLSEMKANQLGDFRRSELAEFDNSKPLEVTLRGGKTKTKSLFGGADKGGGGSSDDGTDAYDTIIKRAEGRIEKLKAERDAIGLTAEAAAKLRYETDLLNQAKQKDIELTPQQTEQLKGLAAGMAKIEIETKNAKDQLDTFKDVTKGFVSDLKDGLKNGEGFFESFRKAAINALDKISDKLINSAIDSLFTKSTASSGGGLLGGIGSLISGLFGGGATGAAAGGLGFALPGIRAAKGATFSEGTGYTNSIVSSPTLFRYAKGGSFGLMGEAGPEAVMPLQRGPNGSLGVQMYGNGAAPTPVANSNVEITNNYRLEGVVSEQRIVQQIKAASEQTKEETKRSIPGWIDQYQRDGSY